MSNHKKILSAVPAPEQIITLRKHVENASTLKLQQARTLCAETVGVGPRSWKRWEDGEREMSPAQWELALLKLRTGQLISPTRTEPPTGQDVIDLRQRVQQTFGTNELQARTICSAAVDAKHRIWKHWEDEVGEMSPAKWELALAKLQTGNPIPINAPGMYEELLQSIEQLRQQREKEKAEQARKEAEAAEAAERAALAENEEPEQEVEQCL